MINQGEYIVNFTESAHDVLMLMADRWNITDDQMFRVCLGLTYDILSLGRWKTKVVVTRPDQNQALIHLDAFDGFQSMKSIGTNEPIKCFRVVDDAYTKVKAVAERLDAPAVYAIMYAVALTHSIMDRYQWGSTVRVHLPWWKRRRVAEIEVEAYIHQVI